MGRSLNLGGLGREWVLFEREEVGRRSDPEPIGDNVPEELRKHLGVYRLGQVQLNFTNLFADGELAVIDPTNEVIVKLNPDDTAGLWISDRIGNKPSFETDDDGA
ncbi:MAG: hypothetical protein ACI8PQ_002247 [Planctomycetota bacterium]